MGREGLGAVKILLVDDYPVIREIIREYFESSTTGFDIVGEAGNGRDAVRLAEELRPDIILMDITMPIMDGLEATEYLTRHHNPSVIITYTSFQNTDLRTKALEVGAYEHLVKPFDFNVLRDLILQAFSSKMGNIKLAK